MYPRFSKIWDTLMHVVHQKYNYGGNRCFLCMSMTARHPLAIYLKALDCVPEEKVGVMKIKCVDVHQPSRVLVAKHYKRLQNKTQTNIVTKADKKRGGAQKS